jgi:pimeloyl-ACP methyl ester carboxylesterase
MDEIGQTLNVNGLNLHVVSAGKGPVVLLLHGFPDTHAVWRKQIGALAEAGFHVIAPDLRGYGESDAPAAVEAYAIEQLRNDIVGLLDALGIDKVRLVGHDWGAAVGWQLCMYAPQRVERFAALSVGHPGAYANAGAAQRLKAWYMWLFQLPGVAEWLLKANDWSALRRFTTDATQFAYWRRELARPGRLTAALNYYRANRKFRVPRQRPAVTMPVLGIWSDRDAALTEGQMRDSAKYVEGGFRYQRIEGADHWLQLTAPERVNPLLLEFLGNTQARESTAA